MSHDTATAQAFSPTSPGMPIASNEISAEAIEQAFGHPNASGRFANFCNAVIVAEGTSSVAGFPVLSEKPGPDGSFDGEWDVRGPESHVSANGFGLPGWNVYQFKGRGISGSGRGKAISGLESNLQGALVALIRRLGQSKDPVQYVLFTNLQLGLRTASTTASGSKLSGDRAKLETAIRQGYAGNATISIIDAAQLAAFVNKHPALRLAYFSPRIVQPWDEKWAAELKLKNYGATVPLVGREAELKTVRDWLNDQTTRVVAIVGPSGMGKSRLALEATQPNRLRTVVAELPRELLRLGVGSLATSPEPVIAIVEDPSEDEAQQLAKAAVVASHAKLVLTFPSEARTPSLKLTEHGAIRTLSLRPLNREQSEKLLTSTGTELDRAAKEWIVLQAGGVPEVLLSAAELGARLREEAGDLKDQLAAAYEKRIRRQLDADAIQVLGLLSLLQWVKVTGETTDLHVMLEVFGLCLTPPAVTDILKRLEPTGHVRVRGDFLAVVPPLLAAAFTEDVFASHRERVEILFDRLEDAARKRLLERAVTTNLDDRSPFWDHVFEGALGTIELLMANLDLLDYLARAVPFRTARFLESHIGEIAERIGQAERSPQRAGFLNTLRELAYVPESCSVGMRLIETVALREASEVETGPATTLFCECFVHWYYEFPLSFQDREQWVRRLLASTGPLERRLGARVVLMATAFPRALWGYGGHARRLDARPPRRLWRDVHDYLEHLLELRFDLTQHADPVIAQLARGEFATVFGHLLDDLPADRLVKALERFLDWQRVGKLAANEREARQTIHRMEVKYRQASQKSGQEKYATEWKRVLDRLAALGRRFDEGPFASRLKIAIGPPFEVEWEEVNGKRVYAFEMRCRELAREALARPELMSDEAWAHLNGPADQAPTFLRSLGELDTERRLLDRFESAAGEPYGGRNLAWYLAGVQKSAPHFVDERLDAYAVRRGFPAGTLLTALRVIGPTEGNRSRLQQLIGGKAVEPFLVADMFTTGRWLDDLPADEIKSILEYIATGSREWPKWLVVVLSLYLHGDRALPVELVPIATQTIRRLESFDRDLDYHCDCVAIGIGKTNLDEAFQLFNRQLEAWADAGEVRRWASWSPLRRSNPGGFWDFLRRQAPERAYRALFPLKGKRAARDLESPLDLVNHLETLLRIAADSEDAAVFLAGLVSRGQPGFFPFAYGLIDLFPASDSIRARLGFAAQYSNGSVVGFGSEADRLEESLTAIGDELKNPAIPEAGRRWLEGLARHLRNEIRGQRERPDFEGFLGWE